MTCTSMVVQDVPATRDVDWDTWFYKPGAGAAFGAILYTASIPHSCTDTCVLLHACLTLRSCCRHAPCKERVRLESGQGG
jgi:hypothetical protein